MCGVTQRSVLGPILFVLYTADLISHIESYGLSPHLYADDTQVYGSCPPAAADFLSLRVSECADAISIWMKSNRLQLNPVKTEVLWCATGRRQHQLPTSAVLIAGVPITPVLFVHDLGIYIDADQSMRIHAQRTVSRCFAALRQFRHIRRCVPATTFQMPVVALVHSWLDYGNSVLVGIPAYLLRRLQSVLNAAARLIFHLKLIAFIGCGYRSAYNTRSPCWVTEFFAVARRDDRSHASPTFLVDGPSVQPPPIVSSCRRSNSPLSAAELFQLSLPASGTRSLNTSSTHLLYSHFNII